MPGEYRTRAIAPGSTPSILKSLAPVLPNVLGDADENS